ncbi:hypothetical protein ACFRFH_00430 [Leifsonia sp. NPDC056824]|uniref:hypothetical protein n=1 Tax=Leifsonia sp. NPDC056824 TaxID=3345953 RepID=UPI0036C1A299
MGTEAAPSRTEWSAVSLDGKYLRSGDGYLPVVLDSGSSSQEGGWTVFLPAAVFPVAGGDRSNPHAIDGTYGIGVDILQSSDGGLTVTTVARARKAITLVPLAALSATPAPPGPSAPTGPGTAAPSSASPTAVAPVPSTRTPTPTTVAAPTVSKLGTGAADADSVYSALTPAQDVHLTLTSGMVLIVLTLILLLLIGFPGVLIESTVSDHYDELFSWVRRRHRVRAAAGAGSPARLTTWLSVVAGVAVASIISGFVDPQFGVNPGSARVLLSSAVVFVVYSVVGWLAVDWVIHSTDPALKPTIEFKWLSLLVVVLSVGRSRLTGFEPGIVFGLVVGLSFGAAISAVESARTALVAVAYSFIVGLGSWLAYSALKPVLQAQSGSGHQFTLDMLAGIAVAGMSTLPVAFLPITGLAGGAVFTWNRWVWGAVYAAGLAAFFVVLMPLPQSWGEVSLALAAWVGLYACFAVAAVLFWGWFRLKDWRKAAHRAR